MASLRDIIKWKVVIVSGAAASVISLTLGGIRGVRTPVLLLRAGFFSLFFAFLAVGINLLLNNFFPDLFTSRNDNSHTEDLDSPSPSRVDIMMDDGGVYEPPTENNDSLSLSKVSGAATQQSDFSTSDDAEEVEELVDVESESNTGETTPLAGRGSLHLNVQDEDLRLDSLSDLSDYSSQFSDGEVSEESLPVTDVASEREPRSQIGSRGTSNQRVQEFLDAKNEPIQMAKTISSVLKRDKEST